jgi:hypothetical protein
MFVTKIDNVQISELKTVYKLDDIQVINIDNILSVLIKMNSQNLQSSWKDINNILSEYLEKYLENSFTRWNVYILFVIEDCVSKELQYKIENNTFFARKIVEDNYLDELNDQNIEKLISEHITFNDLQISSAQAQQQVYSSGSKIYQMLKDIDTINETQIEEILKSLEGSENEI